eukprot:JP445709.1.p1 GENE.JP445709.1~~JP445709.1.p1  ORF type:complete len:57 (-),score=3.71 JP445709.1:39-209(-)
MESIVNLLYALFLVIMFLVLVWFVVWKLLLSRLPVVREFMAQNSKKPKRKPRASIS